MQGIGPDRMIQERVFLGVLLTCSSPSVSPVSGKILFRRSHIRDVAVKRLIPIDEYCKVRGGF